MGKKEVFKGEVQKYLDLLDEVRLYNPDAVVNTMEEFLKQYKDEKADQLIEVMRTHVTNTEKYIEDSKRLVVLRNFDNVTNLRSKSEPRKNYKGNYILGEGVYKADGKYYQVSPNDAGAVIRELDEETALKWS